MKYVDWHYALTRWTLCSNEMCFSQAYPVVHGAFMIFGSRHLKLRVPSRKTRQIQSFVERWFLKCIVLFNLKYSDFIYLYKFAKIYGKTAFTEATSSSQWCALLYNGMAQQASPIVAKRAYGLSYCGQRLLVWENIDELWPGIGTV